MAEAEQRLADQLQRVLDGQLSLDDLLEDPTNRGDALNCCFHGLQHFLMDEDLRAKDLAYREMQEHEMRKLIALLRSNADGERLAKIHFLGRSSESLR